MKSEAEFNFSMPVERRHTASMKWDRYKDRDIIPLWVADMDFCSPPAIIGALHQRVAHGVFGYTHPPESLNAVWSRPFRPITAGRFSRSGWCGCRVW